VEVEVEVEVVLGWSMGSRGPRAILRPHYALATPGQPATSYLAAAAHLSTARSRDVGPVTLVP